MKQLVTKNTTSFGFEWLNQSGEYHREDGPARTWTSGPFAGTCEYYFNGKCHRLDGPAVIYPNGCRVWWINNHDITKYIIPWAEDLGIDLDNLTEDDKIIIQIKWAGYGE